MQKSRLLVVGVVAAAIGALSLALAGAAPHGHQTKLSASDLSLIGGVIGLVQRAYVHPVGTDELTNDALKGMLNRLDPHSDYMDEQEYRETQANIAGKFGGLGMQISSQDGVPKVIAPIDGTPADKAGMQPGDLIVAISGESTRGMGLNKVVSLLRGNPGTKVTISVVRGTKAPFDVTITRSIIQVASVKSKLEPNNVGYVRITEFGEDTPDDFKKAIRKLQGQSGGLKGLVLDLRNDPGGLLTSAIAISSNFLNGGKVVSTHGRTADDDHTYRAASGAMLPNLPVVVLINGASASASEIVAGALQDRHRATVMGTQSFGKGSVQTIIGIKDHGALRLTTALYYTPSDRSIQGQGITPDIVVKVPKDQQIEGGPVLHEAQLQGAFTNPGPLSGKTKQQKTAKSTSSDAETRVKEGHAAYATPIKNDLIGTDKDAQLKAALNYLEQKAGPALGQTAKQ
jgi:carboxyl-terminal processing protease